ncbi:hypothetical protein OHT20_00865 [Streptomyces caniferus]|uniref:Uncharacterized protein n=1 Tax=Streptomyces caniferus TaxID=285557 RepID=A0A640S5N1_9ACTN|nr:hypothetical protein [Streptomyces caniferus]GFE05666.1 hypothetical protein Scani_19340 [Streptomyces caniferus]
MNPPFPRPAKPDYTKVFVEPAYPEGEPYGGTDQDDDDSGFPASGRSQPDLPEGR